MTIRDLLTQTLQDLGVIAAAEDPSAEDSSLALDRLNDWIDSLTNEGLSLHERVRQTWTITSASSYAVGTGATVDLARPAGPEDIQAIGYLDSSLSPSQETLLGRPMTEAQYQGIPQKDLTGVYPIGWYYNPTLPTGTLIPWPVPTSGTLQGVIYARVPLTEYASLSTTLVLPAGYRRFFRTNLLMELADAFKAPTSQRQEVNARESKALVKRANIRVTDLSVAVFTGGSVYDINADE